MWEILLHLYMHLCVQGSSSNLPGICMSDGWGTYLMSADTFVIIIMLVVKKGKVVREIIFQLYYFSNWYSFRLRYFRELQKSLFFFISYYVMVSLVHCVVSTKSCVNWFSFRISNHILLSLAWSMTFYWSASFSLSNLIIVLISVYTGETKTICLNKFVIFFIHFWTSVKFIFHQRTAVQTYLLG